MKQLENRNNVRVANQLQMLSLIRKSKITVTDLANRSGLSFTAASKIIEEMIEEGILRYASKKKPVNSRGRIPVFVEMNVEEGVVCAIDLSSSDIQIIISSLDCKIIVRDVVQNARFIGVSHLQDIEKSIKKLLKTKEVAGRKLLNICIASPGLIRPDKFEYASAFRVPDFDKINPVLFFANAFNVKVEMHNDVRIGCLGELRFGAFPNRPFNGMFAHIGADSGSALVFDGKIYRGTNGFSGELPAYRNIDEISNQSAFSGRLFSLREIANKIAELKGTQLPDPEESVDLDKIVDDYKKGDKATLQAVDESCRRNAITIVGFSTLLDLEYTVIEGPVLKFGSEYLDSLRKYILEYSLNEVRTRIVPSKLGIDSSILGVCYQAVSSYLIDVLEEGTKKRLNSPDFKINPVFRDI